MENLFLVSQCWDRVLNSGSPVGTASSQGAEMSARKGGGMQCWWGDTPGAPTTSRTDTLTPLSTVSNRGDQSLPSSEKQQFPVQAQLCDPQNRLPGFTRTRRTLWASGRGSGTPWPELADGAQAALTLGEHIRDVSFPSSWSPSAGAHTGRLRAAPGSQPGHGPAVLTTAPVSAAFLLRQWGW